MGYFVILSDSRSGEYFAGGQQLSKNINDAKKYASFGEVAGDFESGDDFIIHMDDEGKETERFDWNAHVAELRRKK